MMKATVVALAFLLCPVAAFAQEEATWENLQGRWEFTLSGAGENDRKFDNGAWAIGGSVGYYVTDEVLVSFRQSLGFADTESGSSWFGSSRGAVDYHFDLGRLRPFVGANAGVRYGDDIKDTFILSPEAGLKYYVLRQTFLYGIAEYQWPTRDSFKDDGRFVYTVGIGFNF